VVREDALGTARFACTPHLIEWYQPGYRLAGFGDGHLLDELDPLKEPGKAGLGFVYVCCTYHHVQFRPWSSTKSAPTQMSSFALDKRGEQ